MERFEAKSMTLMPGQKVRARVLSHQPWGLLVEIIGYESSDFSASIDMIEQFARTTDNDNNP